MRTLHLHAGPHKTASTYLQSCLHENRERLSRQGLKVCAPPARTLAQHRPLAVALEQADWPSWHRFLRHESQTAAADLIVSAEQFARPLANPETAAALASVLAEHGFQLHVILFLRDQVDFINAMYVHTLRRLYHGQAFQGYVRRLTRDGGSNLHYHRTYAPLLSSAQLRCTALPFHSAMGDPFTQLLAAIQPELAAIADWHPAAADKANIQPGARGVWLAPQIRRQLVQAGLDPRSLHKPGQAVRTLSERHGWHAQRFWGFTPQQARELAARFAHDNARFAQRAWGQPWEEAVPSRHHQPQLIYREGDDPAFDQQRQALIAEAISVLRAAGNAIPCEPGTPEQLQ